MGVRYAPKVRPGLDGRLTRIRPLMRIWLHPNIARTLTTLRNLKVLNVKENNERDWQKTTKSTEGSLGSSHQ